MGEALNKFVEEARHLSETFDSHTVFSIGGWDISQYTLYMFFILALVLMVVLVGGRKLQLVPKNKFLNTVEYGYDFVNTSIGQDVIGEGFKKHIPFLCTLFFFILIANADADAGADGGEAIADDLQRSERDFHNYLLR